MIARILILTLISLQSAAQQFSPAPFLGMGKTALAQRGIFSLNENPAGIAHISTSTFAMAYQQHFMKSDIASQTLLAGIPLFANGAIGISLTNYGIFNVTSFLRSGATYARSFGPKILTSVTANYHQYSVQQYNSSTSSSVDLGFQYLWSPKISIGLFFRNISGSQFPNTLDQRIAREIGLGLHYQLSKEIQLATDVLKEFPHHFVYRGGVSYFFDSRFVIRTGASSNPLQYTAGTGFKTEKWQFDFATAFHSKLGSSPQLSMSYAF